MKNIVIILGSSRSDGDTAQVVYKIQEQLNCAIIDLNDYAISYYDYAHKNKDDDFLPLMRSVIDNYQTIIVATPVYWYSMSGIMKVFFDRITDLLTIEKGMGNALREKNFGAISCSVNSEVDDKFWYPFRKTAQYLGMNYIGDRHFCSIVNNTAFEAFSKQILREGLG